MICGWITNSYIINFVITTILLAVDFWVTKNVTGRILVGLRWWNHVGPNGENAWRFESLEEGQREVHRGDSSTFWGGMVISVLLWGFLGFISLLKFSFDYLLLVFIAIALGFSNLYGYYKCSKDAQAQLSSAASGLAAKGFMAAMRTGNSK